MPSRKLLFIGAVHTGKKPAGGEEYKNQLLVGYLKPRYTLTIIDTIRWKKNPATLVRLLYHLPFGRYDHIILSASSSSTYRLIQFLNLFPHLIRKTIYLVIGGYYPGAVHRGRFKARYYQKLQVILVQGVLLKKILEKAGLARNVSVMPNFKPVGTVIRQRRTQIVVPIRFVFISRIAEPKGVLTVFKALKELNIDNAPPFAIDFYGPIDPAFEDLFKQKIEEHPSICAYKGYLDIMNAPQEAYQTLSDYDCMLFPTFWQGEGFPGVIIDAYISGLPVIASDWNMNREVIEEGVTGWIIPPKDHEALAQAISRVIKHPEQLAPMREHCYQRALEYDCDTVLSRDLVPLLEGD